MHQFRQELAVIKDQEILSLTEKLIRHFPEPFWIMPASSTGKYHSPSSSGRGGLVNHTRQVFWIAKTMLDTKLYSVNHDVVLAACLLHDGWKYGNSSQYTLANHATVAVREIDNIVEASRFFLTSKPDWYQKILDCILAHNGTFTKEWQGGSFSLEQAIVHTADMIGSRRFLSFNPGGVQ